MQWSLNVDQLALLATLASVKNWSKFVCKMQEADLQETWLKVFEKVIYLRYWVLANHYWALANHLAYVDGISVSHKFCVCFERQCRSLAHFYVLVLGVGQELQGGDQGEEKWVCQKDQMEAYF